MNVQNRIFFHVGLGKTGTTFLQERVFHKFVGINYIDTHKYYKVDRMIEVIENDRNILVSREFDRQLRRECTRFAGKYESVTPVIVFRKHGSYIASQYRRFVKNGYSKPFSSFFNLDDSGYFSLDDLSYSSQIDFLEKTFDNSPIVYVYEDLIENSEDYIGQFARDVGATVDVGNIDFRKKHTSYNEKQLKAMYAVGQHINLQRVTHPVRWINILSRFARYIPKYGILYLASLIPDRWVPDTPLIDPAELRKIDRFFAKDWELVLAHAKRAGSKNVV